MNRALINQVFRKDFKRLLGFDIFIMVDDLEWLARSAWFNDFVIEAVLTPLSIMQRNLKEITDNYLRYDPSRFDNPLDQYLYIHENKDKILAIFDRDAIVRNPFDDPVLYSLRFRIDRRFDRFFEDLLKLGNAHKFDEEEMEEYIMDEMDEIDDAE